MNKLLNISVSDFKLCTNSGHKIMLDVNDEIEFIYHDITVYRTITINDCELIEYYRSARDENCGYRINNIDLSDRLKQSSELLDYVDYCDDHTFDELNDDRHNNLDHLNEQFNVINTLEKARILQDSLEDLAIKTMHRDIHVFDFIDHDHTDDTEDYKIVGTGSRGNTILKLINTGQS